MLDSSSLIAGGQCRSFPRPMSQAASTAAWQDFDLVFASAVGTPIHPDNVTRDYNKLVKLAGVPRIRVHDQRHTHITLSIQAGAPMGAVSKRSGHAKISTTMDLYAHVTPDMQQQAADKINSVLFDQH